MVKYVIPLFILSLLFISCTKKVNEQPKLIEKEIDYTVDSVIYKGYLVYDDNIKGKRPGVLVVHEWWGLNDYARHRARMLAELGYTAFAIDMYGEGKVVDHPEDAGKFANAVFSNFQSAEARFLTAYNFLKNAETTDPEKIAAIGYCFGGGVVLNMARTGIDLDGVVSFHGMLEAISPANPGKVKAKILICNGAADPFTSKEQIENFKKEMDSAKVAYTFINYEGAKHSFTNPAADTAGTKFNLPLVYNEKADRESWDEMKKFFNKIFE